MLDAVRTVLKSAVAILVIYAAWQIAPVYIDYQQLRTEVADATRERGRGPEHELHSAVAALAAQRGVTVNRQDITVSKGRTYTQVEMRYIEQLRPLPGLVYPWTFSIQAEGLAVKPRTMSDVLTDVMQ
tara:strand:+ start:611 stop:994 length:384 start_codon:yes stop_codon:yes gene_type:complete